MKTIGKFSFALLLLAVTFGFTSQVAAESMLTGDFKLPLQTHWGLAVLPAGDYTYAVEMHGTGPVVAVRSVDGKCVGMFIARAINPIEESGSQTLMITRVGDEAFVSSFNLGRVGLSLNYGVPKSVAAVAQKAHGSLVASGGR
jgi:hypothetical protein